MLKPNNIDADNPSYLMLFADSAETTETITLDSGTSLFVGSGPNCSIVLQSDNVRDIHCMIWMDDQNVLKVKDWNTGQTIHNGARIESEVQLSSGDRIGIAEFVLIPVLDREFHLRIAEELFAHSSQGHKLSTPTQNQELQSETETIPSEQIIDTPQNRPEPDNAESALPDGAPTLSEDPAFHYNMDTDLEEDHETIIGCESSGFGSNPFPTDYGSFAGLNEDDNEDVELLRMEVEQLRFELAEKDIQVRTFQDNAAASEERSTSNEDPQTLKLVERLEELLEELKSSDERVRGLEELLRLSDQATQAEQEEREQLELWVNEIENRLEQRESESNAELERLTKRLQETRAQLKHSDQQFKKLIVSRKKSDASKAPSEETNDLVQECRVHIQELRSDLEKVNQENERLKSLPSMCDADIAASEMVRELQNKLAQVEVDSSRERAELARQHAELEKMRGELEEKLKPDNVIGDSDSKIKAMRQHLRAIHEEEKLERENKRQQSLGGRIANLLLRSK